jgi:hypothetical protein
MKKWGKALREKEMQIAIEQRKTPKPLRFQGFLVAETGLEPATSGL